MLGGNKMSNGESLAEELVGDVDSSMTIFEPLNDCYGESDMEGLDLSLFEPQIESSNGTPVHAGSLYLLVHCSGKKSTFSQIFENIFNFLCLDLIYPCWFKLILRKIFFF